LQSVRRDATHLRSSQNVIFFSFLLFTHKHSRQQNATQDRQRKSTQRE
jgi:hypothetical protein